MASTWPPEPARPYHLLDGINHSNVVYAPKLKPSFAEFSPVTDTPEHDDIAACAAQVARADPERFAATMAAPVALRPALFALYAFNTEVARAPWVTQESMIAEMRLQWWRDALEEIGAQGQGGPLRRHEVVTPLAKVLASPEAALLDDLVLARRWDIYRDPFEDETAFHTHIEQTGGILMRVAATMAHGAPLTPEAAQAATDAGYAAGLAAWLRAIPALEKAGRVPLVDGRPEAIAGLANDGLNRLNASRLGRRHMSKPARAAMLPAWLAAPVLQQAAKEPARVAQGALGLSDFAQKARLMRCAMTGRWW
ncbi:phytoene synthase [Litorivita pollutaquae]|uniref:Phytoene synthase n=1 Tax=Litorivita pollutaquae TaxID=2200892 RepID=A0A2V4MPR8_9RHOB|nr:squalene/phytoene synthase family protein [Litorivita pollutaquae]PYC48695.1 phytoene synthase [Litorivita pollutaquae]